MSARGNFPTKTPRQRQIEKQFDTFGQLDKIRQDGVWIDKFDRLQLRSWNSNIAVTSIVLRVRILLLNGDITTQDFIQSVTSNRLENLSRFQTPIGWILNVVVFENTGVFKLGTCFVIVDIFDTKISVSTRMLISHYLAEPFHPTWPGTPHQTSTEGPGFLRVIEGTDPAAGGEVLETVPTNARWKLKSFKVLFITGGAVAVRTIQFAITHIGLSILGEGADIDQLAGLGRNYAAASFGYLPVSTIQSGHFGFYEDIILVAADVIGTNTLNIQAADQFESPTLYVEEWIDINV